MFLFWSFRRSLVSSHKSQPNFTGWIILRVTIFNNGFFYRKCLWHLQLVYMEWQNLWLMQLNLNLSFQLIMTLTHFTFWEYINRRTDHLTCLTWYGNRSYYIYLGSISCSHGEVKGASKCEKATWTIEKWSLFHSTNKNYVPLKVFT